MRHLLSVDDLSIDDMRNIMQIASLPKSLPTLRAALLFLQPSTRTRLSFSLACHDLGMYVEHCSMEELSIERGESIEDTARTVEAMGFQAIVVRDSDVHTPLRMKSAVKKTVIINAGNGDDEHPTQALVDYYTLLHTVGDIKGLRITIVGDVVNSRVARSCTKLFELMGAQVTHCYPNLSYPMFVKHPATMRTLISHDVREAIRNVDVIMALRPQSKYIFLSPVRDVDWNDYQINEEILKLAKPNVVVMHPGPRITGLELTENVALGPHSIIQRQAQFSVPVRRGVLWWCLS